jgi:hypothetical protein
MGSGKGRNRRARTITSTSSADEAALDALNAEIWRALNAKPDSYDELEQELLRLARGDAPVPDNVPSPGRWEWYESLAKSGVEGDTLFR